jgi:hypothetical protein
VVNLFSDENASKGPFSGQLGGLCRMNSEKALIQSSGADRRRGRRRERGPHPGHDHHHYRGRPWCRGS